MLVGGVFVDRYNHDAAAPHFPICGAGNARALLVNATEPEKRATLEKQMRLEEG